MSGNDTKAEPRADPDNSDQVSIGSLRKDQLDIADVLISILSGMKALNEQIRLLSADNKNVDAGTKKRLFDLSGDVRNIYQEGVMIIQNKILKQTPPLD